VQARLELLRRDGTVAWSRTDAQHVSRDMNCGPAGVYLSVSPLADLDADGLVEGSLFVSVFQCDYGTSRRSHFGSGDGVALRDQTSGFLAGSVTPRGADRYLATREPAGVGVVVLRGRDGVRLLSRVVPGTRRDNGGLVLAAPLGVTACSDLLFSEYAPGGGTVAVLASDGTPRWWVTGPGLDDGPGVPRRPARAPSPRCR
jgi:hypothetical protein